MNRLMVLCAIWVLAAFVQQALGAPSLPSGVDYYLPITLFNYQTSAAPANTQVAIGTTNSVSGSTIGFNALAYQQYYTCNLNNAEFFFQNGTVVPSWLEGNVTGEASSNPSCTSDSQAGALANSANIVYWVLLPGNFLPAGSPGSPASNTIYLGWAGNVMSNANTLMDGVNTGEAPELSSTYAEYDDGAKVFSFYMNAASVPSLLSPGSTYQGGNVGNTEYLSLTSVAGINGIAISPLTTSSDAYFFLNAPTLPSNMVLSSWVYSTATPDTYDHFIGAVSASTFNGYSSMVGDDFNAQFTIYLDQSRANLGDQSYAYPYGTWMTTGIMIQPPHLTAFTFNSIGISLPSNAFEVTATNSLYNSFNSVFFAPYYGSSTDNSYISLIVARTYPPNGVQPGDSYGAVQMVPTLSVPSNEFVNPYNGAITATCIGSDTCQIWYDGAEGATGAGTATLYASSLPYGYTSLYANDITEGITSNAQTVRKIGLVANITITLTNSQPSAVSAGAPIPITFNALAYQQYESDTLNNTVLYFGNYTVAHSWIEGNVMYELQPANILYTSNDVLIWLKSPSTSAYLAADSDSAESNTIYMGFAAQSSRLLDGNYIGEAPQLSCANPSNTAVCSPVGGAAGYGGYDNGASMFSYYINFSGSSCPIGWNCGQDPIISNGISVPGVGYSVTTSTYGLNASQILDFYGQLPAATNGNNAGGGYMSSPYYNNGGQGADWEINTGDCGGVDACAEVWNTVDDSVVYDPLSSSASGYHVWTIYLPSTSSANFLYDYGSQISFILPNAIPNTEIPIGLSNNQLSGQNTIGPFNWMRLRTYLPGGVTPSETFSTSQSSPSPPSSSPPGPGPKHYAYTITDNLSSEISAQAVLTVYLSYTNVSYWQDQLPYTTSTTSSSLGVSFACNVTISGVVYELVPTGSVSACGEEIQAQPGTTSASYSVRVNTTTTTTSTTTSTSTSTQTTTTINMTQSVQHGGPGSGSGAVSVTVQQNSTSQSNTLSSTNSTAASQQSSQSEERKSTDRKAAEAVSLTSVTSALMATGKKR